MELKNCPSDGTTLVEINRQGVMIDVCPECKGVWLDRGELDKILSLTRVLESEFGGTPAFHGRGYDQPRGGRDSGGPLDQARRVFSEDDGKYRESKHTSDSDEWHDEDRRRRKKSGLGRLLDIFD